MDNELGTMMHQMAPKELRHIDIGWFRPTANQTYMKHPKEY